jgi:hypothetical protein
MSAATPSERPQKGIGKFVVIGAPLGVLLLGLFIVLAREFGTLRVWTAAEMTFWSRAPVLWSTSWPRSTEDEARQLAREIADVIEWRNAVVGITSLDSSASARALAELVAERLHKRGEATMVLEPQEQLTVNDGDMADELEGWDLGFEIMSACRNNHTVLLVLPSFDDTWALRAGMRWTDVLIVMATSGRTTPMRLAGLRSALGLSKRGLGLVVTGVPPHLLRVAGRTSSPQHDLWVRQQDPAEPGATRLSRTQKLLQTSAEDTTRALPPRSVPTKTKHKSAAGG